LICFKYKKLEGKLEKSGNAWVFQADNGLMIPVNDNGNKRNSGSCCLVFRPQNINVTVGTKNNGDNTIQFQSTVSGKEFLGSTIRYRVTVHGDDVFADVSHQQGRRLIENGTSVNLGINQNQIMIVND